MAHIKELALQVSGYDSQEDSPNFYQNSPAYQITPWEYTPQEWRREASPLGRAFKAAAINLKATSNTSFSAIPKGIPIRVQGLGA